MWQSRSLLICAVVAGIGSILFAAIVVEGAPAFGDRITPRSSQKHRISTQPNSSPRKPASLQSAPVSSRSSIGFIPTAHRRAQRSSYKPQRQDRHEKRDQPKTSPAYETVEDSSFSVPIFAAPAPAQRRGSRAFEPEQFVPSKSFFEASAPSPKAPLKNFYLINPKESAFSGNPLKPSLRISEPFVASENREALTIVPAPDLTPRRPKGVQFSATVYAAASQSAPASHPTQPLSNDNAFYGDDEQRRAVDNAEGGSEDDLFLFEDDDDDFDDDPSWVQPIFGRQGRALERSFYSGLDSRTLRYFTPPSDDELPIRERMSHLDKDVSHDLHVGGVSRKSAHSYSAGTPVYSGTPVYASKGKTPRKLHYSPLPPVPHRDQYANRPLPLEKLPSPLIPYHETNARPAYASQEPAQPSYPPTDAGLDEPYIAEPDYSTDGPADHHLSAADEYQSGLPYPDVDITAPLKSPHDHYDTPTHYHAPAHGNEVAYGAETGDYGAFSYYVDIPVGCSGKYC